MTEQELIEKINTVLADEFEVDRTPLRRSLLLETLDLGQPRPGGRRGDRRQELRRNAHGPDFKELKTFRDFYDLIISRTNGK